MTPSQRPASINQSTNYWSTTSTEQSRDTDVGTSQIAASSADTVWTVLIVSIVMLTIPGILTFTEIRRSWQQWQLNRKLNSSIPCRRCRYFSNNTHLNCAVHPSIAMTEEAGNCPDYQLKQNRRFLKKESPEK